MKDRQIAWYLRFNPAPLSEERVRAYVARQPAEAARVLFALSIAFDSLARLATENEWETEDDDVGMLILAIGDGPDFWKFHG